MFSVWFLFLLMKCMVSCVFVNSVGLSYLVISLCLGSVLCMLFVILLLYCIDRLSFSVCGLFFGLFLCGVNLVLMCSVMLL